MDAKEKHFILERIYQCWKIGAYTYDEKNNPIDRASRSDVNGRDARPTDQELAEIRAQVIPDGTPIFLAPKGKIYYMAFLASEILYVFGPIATNLLTLSELHAFSESRQVRSEPAILSAFSPDEVTADSPATNPIPNPAPIQQSIEPANRSSPETGSNGGHPQNNRAVSGGPTDAIPVMQQKHAISCLILIYYMLTGNQLSDSNLSNPKNPLFHIKQEEMTLYHYHNDYRSKEHLPYLAEQKFLEQIENGTLEQKGPDLSMESLNLLEGIGTLAREDSLKQLEYMVAAVISLASRAAIRGGVSPGDVYPVSELFFQKLAQASTELEYISLSQNVAFAFSEMVRKSKQERSKSGNYVEQCKQYIAQHRNQKYSVQDIADALHLNRSYLSQLFKKECGITIQDYIMEQRLTFAENLLKYSDVKISEISDYLGFNSQSHFAQMFSRKNGVTPSQYRRENQVIDYLGK